MKLKGLLTTASLLLTITPLHATTRHFVQHLNHQVTHYQCLNKNIALSKHLHALLSDHALRHAICRANPDRRACQTSPLGLKQEALGLANISAAPKASYCQMASEDQAQLRWYFSLYLQHNH